jgi:predicted unusual protein kinase regulating ubiquinone biosynthesis (AarF/ABC1/UbiB family)
MRRRGRLAEGQLTADALSLLRRGPCPPPPAPLLDLEPAAITLRASAASDAPSPAASQTRATLALRVPVLELRPRQPDRSRRREADVALRLPPGLRLSATSRGQPDVRLDLLDVLVSWSQTPPSASETGWSSSSNNSPLSSSSSPPPSFGGRYHRLYPAQHPGAAAAVRGGALLLAHALFPDAAARLVPALALPAAAVDVAAPLALALAPQAARRAARDLWGGSGRKGEGDDNDPQSPTQAPFCPPAPFRLAAAATHATLHALRSMSPPAAALASAAWLWRVVEPNSLLLLKGVAALAAVSADYNTLRRDAAFGRYDDDDDVGRVWGSEDEDGQEGGRLDAARRRAHRRAARRVAPFMRELPGGWDAGSGAPLAPALAALGRVSVAAALAVGGVALSGAPAAVGGSSGGGVSSTAWLGWDPSPSLRLSIVVDAAASSEAAAVAREARQHAASGLDRGELLSLFSRAHEEKEEDGGDDPAGQGRPRKEEQEARRGSKAAVDDDDASETLVLDVDACCSSSCATSPDEPDPLAFLDRLPLYGRPEVAAAAAAAAAAPSASSNNNDDDAAAIMAAGREGRLVTTTRAEAELALRGARLLLAFLPFAVAGLPLLLAASVLMARARERERQALGLDGEEEEEEENEDDNADDDAFWRDPAKQQAAAAAWRRRHEAQQARRAEAERRRRAERELEALALGERQAALARILRAQLATLHAALAAVAALLELLLLLALGGDWMAAAGGGGSGNLGGGGGPFEAAALRLRRAAWSLLVAGCARSGAAVIKCGQWAAVRRDLFSPDLCDALSALHDAAPSHGARETRRALERAGLMGGGRRADLCFFESFDWEPVASGSIAQVHRAVLRRLQCGGGGGGCGNHRSASESSDGLVVAVKVRHPGVARHIAMDFLMLHRLAALVERAWLRRASSGGGSIARGPPRTPPPPPLVHTLGQFSRTMAAQADLRVEAVHMLRFARDFGAAAVVVPYGTTPPPPPQPIAVPLPLPGLASAEVLVETFEPGASVGRHLAAAVAERALQERRARERRLERRRRERECAERLEAAGAGTPAPLPPPPAQDQAEQRRPQLRSLLRRSISALGRVLLLSRGMKRRRKRRTRQRAGNDTARDGDNDAARARSQAVALFLEAWLKMLLDTGFMHQDLHPGNLLLRPLRAAGPTQEQQQLVLLDFGLAEALPADVRRHFTSFLFAVAAGCPAHATRHLLQWSSSSAAAGAMPASRKRVLLADVADRVFLAGGGNDAAADASASHSSSSLSGGIDLDAVLSRTLALVRAHGLSLDASYALLCMGCCSLVRCAAALDPQFNLMDAMAPELLAHALLGRALGGCTAGVVKW